jgi:hypothetical protein
LIGRTGTSHDVVDRQTVSLELKRLEDAGYICVKRRAISLLQRQQLQQLVAGNG